MPHDEVRRTLSVEGVGVLDNNLFADATAVAVNPAIPSDSLKGAVYTIWIFICIWMSRRVCLFAKKMKFLTKGGIHCISQVFPWHFYFMREHSLVELTEHDDSAANIIVHSMYTVHICIAAFIVHISVYR